MKKTNSLADKIILVVGDDEGPKRQLMQRLFNLQPQNHSLLSHMKTDILLYDTSCTVHFISSNDLIGAAPMAQVYIPNLDRLIYCPSNMDELAEDSERVDSLLRAYNVSVDPLVVLTPLWPSSLNIAYQTINIAALSENSPLNLQQKNELLIQLCGIKSVQRQFSVFSQSNQDRDTKVETSAVANSLTC